jgi:isoleucyl-tRNA synthetase
MKLKNKYYIMRHGQAKSNVKRVCSNRPEKFVNHLTKYGEEIVRESAEKLKKKIDEHGQIIDLIFCSPLLRTKKTAEIVGKIFNIKPKVDLRLREVGFGIFNGKNLEKMWRYFKYENDRIKQKPPKGESYEEILKRMFSFLKDADKKYKGRNILIISHEGPLSLLQGKVMGLSIKQMIERFPLEKRIHKGEIRELN